VKCGARPRTEQLVVHFHNIVEQHILQLIYSLALNNGAPYCSLTTVYVTFTQ